MHKLTKDEHSRLITELEENLKGIVEKHYSEVSEVEQQRIDEISEILNNCEVIE